MTFVSIFHHLTVTTMLLRLGQQMGRDRAVLHVITVRSLSAAAAAREPKDLHAAWASLACYDSDAVPRLNSFAETAKSDLRSVGYELKEEFTVHGGKALSFDGKTEVNETDSANLWVREADGRGILAFRGSDTKEDLEHVRNPTTVNMYGHKIHAGVQAEFAPLIAEMSTINFADLSTLVVTGHSLGGGCATLFAVLMNDADDPLSFGPKRKRVDELYGFGATPVFHCEESETANEYGNGDGQGGSFKGGIYRALKKSKSGPDVQDRAFTLATQSFHFPKTNLVSLWSSKEPPEAIPTSKVQGAPGWRARVKNTGLDDNLFPLHSPVNYVSWLGTQKKRLVVVGDYDGEKLQ